MDLDPSWDESESDSEKSFRKKVQVGLLLVVLVIFIAGGILWATGDKSSRARELSAAGELTYHAEGCDIKGSGNLYYLPTHSDYREVTILASEGDRWFCSEQDARANGFLKDHERIA